jgi:hypothetical protein
VAHRTQVAFPYGYLTALLLSVGGLLLSAFPAGAGTDQTPTRLTAFGPNCWYYSGGMRSGWHMHGDGCTQWLEWYNACGLRVRKSRLRLTHCDLGVSVRASPTIPFYQQISACRQVSPH